VVLQRLLRSRPNLVRLAIAALLALCGLLCGCSDIASLRITLSANPLSLAVELTGPTAPGSLPTYTLPAGGILSVDGPSTQPVQYDRTPGPATAPAPTYNPPAALTPSAPSP
jgi:hypothetical protein